MERKEYLFKTLSRTKRKDDENYVLNAIWNKVNNLELMPVTQQYVRCGSRWYLIDMFFPQINLGIEVYEAGHNNSVQADLIRSDEIVSAMIYDNRTDYDEIVIYTSENDINSIHDQINASVNKINEKIKTLLQPLHWNTHEEFISIVRNKGILSVFDNITFSTITQVLNEVFDYGRKGGKGPTKVLIPYKFNKDYSVWFARRNIFINDIECAVSGWINRLSLDGREIIEFEVDKKESTRDWFPEKRITFLKYKNNLGENGYKFVGVFVRNGWTSTTYRGNTVNARKYTLMYDYMDLPK